MLEDILFVSFFFGAAGPSSPARMKCPCSGCCCHIFFLRRLWMVMTPMIVCQVLPNLTARFSDSKVSPPPPPELHSRSPPVKVAVNLAHDSLLAGTQNVLNGKMVPNLARSECLCGMDFCKASSETDSQGVLSMVLGVGRTIPVLGNCLGLFWFQPSVSMDRAYFLSSFHHFIQPSYKSVQCHGREHVRI